MSNDRPDETGDFQKVTPTRTEPAEDTGESTKVRTMEDFDLAEILVVQPATLIADSDPEAVLTDMAKQRWQRVLAFNLDRLLGPPN